MSVLRPPDQALEELAALAAHGDARAAAMCYAETLPYLHGAAIRFAPELGAEAREDLIQDAWAKLLKKWAKGAGPEQNVRGYLVRTMRNAYLDERVSARSRVASLETLGEEPEDQTSGDRLDRVDLFPETLIVRKAYDSLNPKYRELLTDSVVNGLKPAEIAAARGKTAGAVSAQLVRAKHRLRYGTLVQYLSLGGAECARHAESLPENACDHPDGPDAVVEAEHQRSCPECRRNWRRFALIVEALGIVPLLVIGGLMAGGGRAEAATSQGNESEAAPGEGTVPRPRSLALSIISSKWTAVGAVALVALSALSFSLSASRPAGTTSAHSVEAGHVVQSGDSTDVAFDAWVSPGQDATTLSVRLSAPGDDAVGLSSFSLQLPQGTALAENPSGWQCETSAETVDCVRAAGDVAAIDIVLVADGADRPSGHFRIDLDAGVIHEGESSAVAAWAQGDL